MFVKHYLRHIHKCATGTDRQISKLFKSAPEQYKADNLATLIVCFQTIAIFMCVLLLADRLFPAFLNIKAHFDKYYYEIIFVSVVILFFIVNRLMDKYGRNSQQTKYSWTDPILIIFYFFSSAGFIIFVKKVLEQN